jgi:hypothetical protein
MKSAPFSRGHQAGGIEKKRPAHGGTRLGDPTTTARRPDGDGRARGAGAVTMESPKG